MAVEINQKKLYYNYYTSGKFLTLKFKFQIKFYHTAPPPPPANFRCFATSLKNISMQKAFRREVSSAFGQNVKVLRLSAYQYFSSSCILSIRSCLQCYRRYLHWHWSSVYRALEAYIIHIIRQSLYTISSVNLFCKFLLILLQRILNVILHI
jgi:hypothetical protein